MSRGKLDNYGQPTQEYVDGLMEKDDEALKKECERTIWLSSYAGNNPRSDYHWQVDACYAECERRVKPGIYQRAYRAIEHQVLGQ